MSQELCIKALEKMPVSFSSTRFSKQLKKWNADPSFISNGVMFKFLLQNCNQDGMRSWSKKREAVNVIQKEEAIKNAITLLKSTNRFRIMEKAESWNEI